ARSAPPFLAIRGHRVVRASSSFKLYRHLFSLLQAVSPRLSYCRRSSTAFESAPVAVPAVPPPWRLVAAIATRRIVSISSPLFHFCRAASVPSGSNPQWKLLPKSKKEVETETLASSSFKNRSFFFLDLGASVPGIHLLHRAPAAVRRALSHHRLRLVVADSSNPPPSSELCSSPGLCLRHDSAPLFLDCSEEKPISIPVSFLRVQRAEAQPRKKP
ncbi:hypothetical protein HN51_005287, partial [Arachis hypogaea]